MNVGCRRSAVVIGSLLLLCSLGFGGWEPLTLGIEAELNAVHFPTGTQVGYVVGSGMDSMGGFAGFVAKTTDGGTTWTEQASGVPDPLKSVYFKDDDNGYAVGDAAAAIRTTDGGATWTTMTVPGTDMLNYVAFPENTMTGYIGVYPRTSAGKVLKTTDGGDNWTSITVGGALNWSRSCGMATDNIGVAVGNGGFVVGTTDGFGSTTVQGPRTIANMTAAAFSPTDPLWGYLIGNDSVHGLIRFTDDGGANLWDSVRCWRTTIFYDVDVPTSAAAYVCGDSMGTGIILRSVSNTDFYKTTTPPVPAIRGLCFPNAQEDTGYAVGGAGTILRTYDKGIPWIIGVAEGKVPAISRTGIRVTSNPSRHGIALHSDADVTVSVFDAAGRVVMNQTATRGLNFLPLPTGAYFVKAGASTARAVVTD
jgi:photosystem II stability/assembly factor-like uncharacterized protein